MRILEFYQKFPDAQSCKDYLKELREKHICTMKSKFDFYKQQIEENIIDALYYGSMKMISLLTLYHHDQDLTIEQIHELEEYVAYLTLDIMEQHELNIVRNSSDTEKLEEYWEEMDRQDDEPSFDENYMWN